MLYAGFLSDNDVRRSYRVSLPYISNPYTTIDQTSRSITRRLTGVGGPSFYISLLGQDNLEGELSINVTFDTTLDWSESEPILVYWDIGKLKIIALVGCDDCFFSAQMLVCGEK